MVVSLSLPRHCSRHGDGNIVLISMDERGSLGTFFRKFPSRDFPGGPCTSTAGDMGLIPGQGTKTPHAMHSAPPKKKEN